MSSITITKENQSASFPVIKLKRGIPHRVFQKHLWIYKTEIENYTSLHLEPGSIVDVVDCKGEYIGCGFYSSSSEIAIRLFSFEKNVPDKSFWCSLIKKAIDYRKATVPLWTSRRLVNSESDFIPGLIVDQYENVIVIQTLTQGADRIKNLVVEILCEELKPEAIFEQNNSSVRQKEKLPHTVQVVYGKLPDKMYIKIGEVSYDFKEILSHKTTFYLDQQENYSVVSKFVKDGMKVLDLFSYAGGFALHALLKGAAEIVAVDVSSDALNIGKLAAERMAMSNKLHIVQENVFDFLRNAVEQKQKFDFIILDPPSFTRTRQHIKEARRGYKELHLKAFKLLTENGRLATFCCSHHISQTMFRDYINEAAVDTNVMLRREAVLAQAPDHPVVFSIPETEYLKGFVFGLLI
jgi:23S rRNA (cytosine1962-C5)-methyltransferase